jgi:hypothetical protein
MLRSLLRASAAIAFAALIAPPGPAAAPGPGLAYDEIVRVITNATPPPPGSFAADAAAISTAPATPTPAPRKRGFGNLVGSVISGGPGAAAGAAAGEATGSAVDQSVGASFGGLAAAARTYLQPRLLRYAYWNGWERIDDPASQTATIRKCDLAQAIALDLAAKTYRISDSSAEASPAAAPAPARARGGRPAPDPQQPGTAVATLSEVTKSLPGQRIENYAAAGYDSTMSFSMAQSTGSCRDSSGSIETIQYLAPLQQPTVTSCPIRRPPLPATNAEVVIPSGGCRPTFSVNRTGPTPPSNRLALYALVEMGQVGFLTERGNLRPLGAADAALFSPPADFTRAP